MVYPEKWEEVLELVKAFTKWDSATTEQAIQELVNLGEVAVHSLLNLYTDYRSQGFPEIPELIVEVLRRIGKPAVRVLLTFLEDNSIVIKRYAARILGELRDEEAIEPLRRLFEATTVQGVGEACSVALCKLGEKGLGIVFELTYSADNDHRAWAAFGLSASAKPTAKQRLFQLVQDPEVTVRRAAAWALGNFSGQDVIDALIIALKDDDAWVKEAIIAPLGFLLAGDNLQPIIEILDDKSSPVRAEAVRALGYSKNKDMIKILEPLLKDESEQVRVYTANALEELTQSLEQENKK